MNLLKPNENIVAVVKCRQCIDGESYIETQDGRKMIKDLLDFRGKVWTFDDMGLVALDKVLDVWKVGSREVFRIDITGTKHIIATAEHKVFTYDGWKTVSELEVGTRVRTFGHNGVEYLPVKKIRKLAKKRPVYDMTTEKFESYLANGIHVHNSGFSTCIQGKALHRAYFGKVPEILITSAGQNQSIRVLKKIKTFFNSMPEFMRVDLEVNKETQIQLANGTVIYSLPANADTCRGFTGDVFLDEYGVQTRKDGDELWEALLPCIAKGYNMVTVSTPKGKQNMFYDLCNPKKDEEGNIVGVRAKKIIEVPWYEVPHIAKVIEDFRMGMHPKQFSQEFECQFMEDVEHSLFPYDFLMDHVVDQRTDGVRATTFNEIDNLSEDVVPEFLKRRDLTIQYPNGIYIGWDIALTGDGSVVTVFGVTKEDIWEMIAYKKFPGGTDLSFQVPYVSKMAQLFCAKKLTFDATGGLGLAAFDLLRKTPSRGILVPFKFTPQSKSQEYSQMRGKMAQEGFRIPEIQECLQEFMNLGINPTTGRIGAMGNQHKNHDDWPSSFICAYAGRKKTFGDSGFTFV